jgi:medium-chain acyl-[acyl-carrier-protein] hydrolase
MSLSRPIGQSKTLWFEHLSREKQPALRMFCFPYAGGSSQVFRTWQRYFPPEIDLCLAHLPGRGPRISEKAYTSLQSLVSALAEHLCDQIDIPFVFYGHSMGSLISFELARELFRKYNTGPRHLFLSGRYAPQWPKNERATFSLPEDEFIAEVRDLNGTPDELLNDPETRQLFLPLLRADFQLVQTYKYQKDQPLPCPLTIYGGLQDRRVPVESLRDWSSHSISDCKVRMFNGDHFFIRSCEKEFVNMLRNDVVATLYT